MSKAKKPAAVKVVKVKKARKVKAPPGVRITGAQMAIATMIAKPDPEAPTPAILDALAAIARRMDRFITDGVGNDLQSRIRTRLDTPGLREWIAARLMS